MRKLILILSFTSLFFGCKDPFKDTLFRTEKDVVAVGEWLTQDPQYSHWVAMLHKADLFNALNLGAQSYTCFVANNDAVERYIAEHTSYESLDHMSVEDTDYLMRYHIIPGGKIISDNLLLKLSLPTASGDYLTAGLEVESGIRYIDNGRDRPRSIVLQNEDEIVISNGVVHQMDNMLLPFTETIRDVLAGEPRYSLFYAAAQACGLDEWLNEVMRSVGAVNPITIRANKTMMVVSDEVFESNGITTLDQLKARFAGDPADESSQFYQWMLYHLMDKLSSYAELTDFPEGYHSMTIHSCMRTKGISVLDTGGQISFNPQNEQTLFHIISDKRDIPTKNGYIHEIDNLMVVPEVMERYVTLWEPTDAFEFQVIPFYRARKSPGSSVQKFDITGLGFPGLRWESVPASRAEVWYQSSHIDGGRYLYHDALYWNMGEIGWFEMDTPVLPMGRMDLQVEKSNDGTYGGFASVYWDDLLCGTDFNFKNGTTNPTWYTRTLTSEEQHTIRITTTTAGHFGIDRFLFIPSDDE